MNSPSRTDGASSYNIDTRIKKKCSEACAYICAWVALRSEFVYMRRESGSMKTQSEIPFCSPVWCIFCRDFDSECSSRGCVCV